MRTQIWIATVALAMFAQTGWTKQATSTPATPGAVSGTPSTSGTTINGSPSATGTQNNTTTNNASGTSTGSSSDTMGVNPARPTTRQPSPSGGTMPLPGVTPESTVRPYDSTVKPYDSTTNPGSDTIDDTGARSGGLQPAFHENSMGAEDPSGFALDAEMTQKIRNELQSRDLSDAAKHVTIITNGGMVTLRGKVPSMSERQTVQSVAKAVSNNVRNEITVAK